MTFPPIERACYWLARRPLRPVEPLEGVADGDVVVVGAGLTGLWTALFLKALDPAANVVILEQEIAAYGASGRNAGMLAETVDHSHGLAIQHFGAAEARTLARLGEANVAEMAAFLRERGIDCAYEPTGRLIAALTEGQLEECHRSVQVARDLGLDSYRSLTREEFRAEIRSPLYLGGVQVSGGGILDPVMLVDGLRTEAERLGVRVHEQSKVESVRRHGAGVEVRTSRGRVTARRAVLATSAYTHQLWPSVAHRFIPLYDYILVSEPLTPDQREADWLARPAGRHRWAQLLQLLSPDGGRPDPLGHQRGGLLGAQPGGLRLRPLTGPLRRSPRELPPTLPGAGEPGVSLRVGRAHLLHHAADTVLRPRHGRPRSLRARLHRTRAGDDEAGRSHPRPPGARSSQRAARSGHGAPSAFSLPARATPSVVRRPRHARAPAGGRGGAPRSPAPPAGSNGDRVFELS